MLNINENIWINENIKNKSVPAIALLRIRNKELIIKDTLDHISEFVDIICCYDDNSTDNTIDIIKSHNKVGFIIENKKWLDSINDRLISETRHRQLILSFARKYYNFNWVFCCDADERYIGNIREFILDENNKYNSVRIQLFDAYITKDDNLPYIKDQKLINFRQFFGPEKRNILMLWKENNNINFKGLDKREPTLINSNTIINFFCQHYGKSLSIDHWEETCDYYSKFFPWDLYGKKWNDRKGNSIHELSDFGRKLYPWGNELFKNSILI